MTMADVAFLARLDESTISRLWTDTNWFDKVKGRTLQAVIGAVPGVAESLADYALARRRVRLIDELSDHGLQVREETFRRLVVTERIPEQWVSGALEAVLYIAREDDRNAASCLTRFWGRQQNRALGFLWSTDPHDGLISDINSLLRNSVAMSERLADHGNSFHAIIAHATLVHHIARATGCLIRDTAEESLDRRSVTAYRSGVMGRIIRTGDTDEAQHYTELVRRNTLLTMLECWAFPTYSRDAPVTADFSVPRTMTLHNFALDVIDELDTCNDAYLHYLVSVAIPLLRDRDPTLGLREEEFLAKLQNRVEVSDLAATKRVGRELFRSLCLLGRGQRRRVAGKGRIPA